MRSELFVRISRYWRLPLCFTLGCACLLLIAIPSRAAELASGWEITADSLTYVEQPEQVQADGEVVIVRMAPKSTKPFTVRADHIDYDVVERKINARGNILMEAADERLSAETALIDLESQTGSLTDTVLFYADSNMYLGGNTVEKTGEFTYKIEEGWASACKPFEDKAPAWRVKARSGRVTVDGMALFKHATFQIKDVSVLYTPILLFPAKTKRESGLLFPEFSNSTRNGNGLLAPLFIDISPSVDATLYPGYLEKRGTQLGAEFRYVLSDRSRGTMALSYLNDRHDDRGDDYLNDGFIRTEVDRYWFRAKANHDFGANIVGKVDYDYVSDRDFLGEFRDGLFGFDRSRQLFLDAYSRSFQEETIANRETTTQLTKRWDAMLLGGELRAVQDLDGIEDSVPLQSLPRINFNGRMPLKTVPLTLAWDSEYIYYWREQGLGAHRFDTLPRLVMPISTGGAVEGRLSAGVRETVYQVESHGSGPLSNWHHDRTQTRTLPVFEAETATLLLRHFRPGFKRIKWLGHLMRPGLKYEYMPDSEPDAENGELPELDSVDLFNERNWLTFELKNYFSAGGQGESGYFFRNFGYFNMALTYDIREDRRGLSGVEDEQRPLSDLRFDLLLQPFKQFLVRYQTNLSLYGQGVTRYELTSRLASARGDSLRVDYRYLRDASMMEPFLFVRDSSHELHDLDISGEVRLSRSFLAKAAMNRSFSSDRTIEYGASLTYNPDCWAVELRMTQTPDDQRFMVMFSLEGIGQTLGWALNDF